jgi:hypothetical protein
LETARCCETVRYEGGREVDVDVMLNDVDEVDLDVILNDVVDVNAWMDGIKGGR